MKKKSLISLTLIHYYNHQILQDFKVCVTEEFIEHASEGALSIEVWGHRSPGFSNNNTWDPDNRQARSRSLLDR